MYVFSNDSALLKKPAACTTILYFLSTPICAALVPLYVCVLSTPVYVLPDARELFAATELRREILERETLGYSTPAISASDSTAAAAGPTPTELRRWMPGVDKRLSAAGERAVRGAPRELALRCG